MKRNPTQLKRMKTMRMQRKPLNRKPLCLLLRQPLRQPVSQRQKSRQQPKPFQAA